MGFGSHPSAGVVLATLSAAAFGTVAPLAKLAYDDGAEIFPLLALRFALAAVLLVAFHRLTGRTLLLPRREMLRLIGLGAVAFSLEASLFFAALERAPAGVVTLIFYSYPVITTLLSFAFGIERPQGRTVVALALGSIGVATIFGIEGVPLSGLLLAAASAVAVALYYIAAGVFMRGVSAGAGATWTAIGAASTTGVLWLATGQELPSAALPEGTALGTLTAFAFLTLYAAVVRLGPSRTSVAQMLEPVVTVGVAAVFLDEDVTLRIALGALLIVSSLPILASTGREEEVAPAPDSL